MRVKSRFIAFSAALVAGTMLGSVASMAQAVDAKRREAADHDSKDWLT